MAKVKYLAGFGKFLLNGLKGLKNPAARKAFVATARSRKVGRLFVNRYTAKALRSGLRSTRFMKSKAAILFKNHRGLKTLLGGVGTTAVIGTVIGLASEYMSGEKSSQEALEDINKNLDPNSALTLDDLANLSNEMVKETVVNDDFQPWLALGSPFNNALKATLEPLHAYMDMNDGCIIFDVVNKENALALGVIEDFVIDKLQSEFASARNLTNAQVLALITRGTQCMSEDYLAALAQELSLSEDSRMALVDVIPIYDTFILSYLDTLSETWPVHHVLLAYFLALGYYISFLETTIIPPSSDVHMDALGIYQPPFVSNMLDGVDVAAYRQLFLNQAADDGLATDSNSVAANTSAVIQNSSILNFVKEANQQSTEGETSNAKLLIDLLF